VNKSVCNIFKVEVLATGSEIALIVPIPLQITIHSSDEGVTSNVELSIFIKQWLFNVFLNDIGSFLPIHICILDYVSYLLQLLAYLYAASSIRIFTWLNDPNSLS
jgi:hypothetical protein